ncbi:MAG: amidase [Proteobacteria bacterium]|nr:amidase [Pseudomonadota bacterium]
MSSLRSRCGCRTSFTDAELTDGDIIALSASEVAARIARGDISAVEYSRACLERIASLDNQIRAFAHVDPDHVIAQARALDERRADGHASGPLHGVAVAIKDIFDTADYPTECGSPLFSGRRPLRDASVVARLRAAGAVIIGKTVTTELAYYHPGPTRNPRDLERTPGGSSSGSAAAVAAGMAPLALGSQTNGSVIRPAAFCGVFGMKPSHGLVSRAGVLELSRVLDHVGGMGRTLDDLALLLDVIIGHDARDPDTRPFAVPTLRRVLHEAPPLPPRFAFVRTPIWEAADAATRAAFEGLAESLGAQAGIVALPERFARAWDMHRVIMAADMAHRFGALVAKAGDQASDTLRKLIDAGAKVTATEYFAAVDEAQAMARGLAEIFDYYDAIITPATPGVAPKGLETTGNPAFCTLWTLVGLPAVTLPILADEDGLPLGVQLIGAAGDDARLLRTARSLLSTLNEA